MFLRRTIPLLSIAALLAGCPEPPISEFNNSNEPPVVLINSHADGDLVREGELVTFIGLATDPDDTQGDLTAEWLVNGGEVCEPAILDEAGETSCTTTFAEGKATVILRVIDGKSASADATVSLEVEGNAAPSISLVSPNFMDEYVAGNPIPFEIFASDVDDDAETLTVTWTSDLDGNLGLEAEPDSNGSIQDSSTLSQGLHFIKVVVTDPLGSTDSDSISIEVQPINEPPTGTITAPADGSTGVEGDKVNFKGEVGDDQTPANLLEVAWRSDKHANALGESTPSSSGDVSFPYADLLPGLHVITMSVTDEDGLSWTDQIDYEVGTPPTLALKKPAPGDVYRIGEAITFKAEVEDQEDAPTKIGLEWSSSQDDLISEQGADSTGLAQFTKSDLSEGEHTLTVTATDTSGLFAQTLVTFSVISNSPPSLATVDIAPADPTTEDDLSCTYAGFIDDDNDPDKTKLSWRVNGKQVGTTSVLDASLFEKGDDVSCKATPNDGFENGSAVTDSVTIGNSAPSLVDASITPNSPKADDSLLCDYTGFEDVDDDDDLSTFAWFVNGASAGDEATLDPEYVAGDIVVCRVTPFDGEDSGDAVEAEVEVDNSEPSVSAVQVVATTDEDGDGDESTALATDELACLWDFDDVDGHGDNSTVVWSDGSADLGTDDSLIGVFAGGDTITCTVTADDGLTEGGTAAASITIDNSAPIVSDVQVVSLTDSDGDGDDTTAAAADTLECVWAFEDADQDADMSTVVWTDGIDVLGTDATLSGAFVGGDTVSCTVTAHDGTLAGNDGDASLTIDNTAPSVSNVTVTATTNEDGDNDDTTATNTDWLLCSWDFEDLDSDADLSTVFWTDGTGIIGTSAELDGALVDGDTVTCVVVPNDGTESSPNVDELFAFDNAAPSVSDVTVTATTDADDDQDASTAVAADSLLCEWTFTDTDGDDDDSTVAWTDGAQTLGIGNTLSGVFVGGDEVTCVVTPNDGVVDGAAGEGAIVIGNSAPVVSNVEIASTTDMDGDSDAATAVVGDTLECVWDFSDVDGDSDVSSVSWQVGNQEIGTGDTISSGFVGGDSVLCVVTPDDGEGEGVPVDSGLEIENTAPEVSEVSVLATTNVDGDNDDATAVVGDELQCTWTFSDADEHGDASTVVWTIDGDVVGTGIALDSDFVGGDDVQCEVTANDGTSIGNRDNAVLSINNTAPTVSQVVVSATTNADGDNNTTTATAADTLSCSWTFADVDGNDDASTVSWWVNSTVVGTTSTLSGEFVGDDEVTCEVVANDGESAGNTANDALVIDNTAPVVSGVVITATTNMDGDNDPATASVEDSLLCSWNFDDADASDDASTMSWDDANGQLGTSASLAGPTTDQGSVTCTVTAYDGELEGNVATATLLFGNAPPTVASVVIEATTNVDGDDDPSTAVVGDTLACTWDYADSDNDPEASTLVWSNGTDDLGSETTLSSGFFGGNSLTCTVTAHDGSVEGNTSDASIEVGNTAPMVSNVAVAATTDVDSDANPATAVVGDTLECTWDFSDVDGDDEDSTVVWSDGSGDIGTGTTLSSGFVGGETVTCSVTANDGSSDGNTGDDSLTIDNTAPVIGNVTVGSTTDIDGDGDTATAVVGDTLACSWDFEDADGDDDSSTVAWSNGSGQIGTGPTLSSGFVGQETVFCTVTGRDGSHDGNSGDDSLTIDNTAPTVSNVTVAATTNVDGDSDEDTAVVGDTLVCTWDFADADGSDDSSTVVWTDGGGQIGTESTLSSGFVGDETVTCTVTANDGSVNGNSDNAILVIDNTLPTVSNVAVAATTNLDGDNNPATAVVGDTLECTWDFDDADGGDDNSDVEFTDGEGQFWEGPTLSSGFVFGETVTCTVTANDGSDDGTSDSDSLVIDNTAPTVSNVAVAATTNTDGDNNPATAVVGDTLACTWDFLDVDGADDDSTVVWTDGSGQIGTGDTVASGFVGDETVTCTVTAKDGTDDGNSDADALTVNNTAPVISNVSVVATTDEDGDNNPATAGAADTLLCAWDYSDADDNDDASTVSWVVDNAEVGTDETLSGEFVGHDNVTCEVEAHDGETAGNTGSDSLDIDNSAPTVSGVIITATTNLDGDNDPSTGSVEDSLLCSWTFVDADGNDDLSTVSWDDVAGQLGTSAALAGPTTDESAITCTVTAEDGEAQGNQATGTMLFGNSPPTVSNAVVQATTNLDGDNDPSTAVVGDTLECTWSFSDPDNDDDASTVAWSDGTNTLGTSVTLDSGFFGGENISCTVTGHDGNMQGNSLDASIDIDNTAPTVSDVVVVATTNVDGDNDPETAVVGDTLRCSWDFSDVDGDDDASTVAWTDGSGQIGTGTTVSSGFVGDETVTCTVTANDGTAAGGTDSGGLTIGNTAPSVSNVAVAATTNLDGDNNSATAVVGDTLACTWDFADVDGDGDASTVVWSDDSGDLGTDTTVSAGFVGGETVTCTVTADDGTDTGATDGDSLVIGNSAPSVSNVVVAATTNVDGDNDPTTAVVGDTLECTWDFSDVDGDDDASTVVWTDDGGQLGTGTTVSSGFVGGETVTCHVTPNDGDDVGTNGNDSLTIGNTAPTVSSVAVAAITNLDGDNDPATAVVGDTLECTWNFSDVDADDDASTVVWSDGSGQIGTGATVSSGFVGDETVTCTVTAHDGIEGGSSDNDSLTIDNTAPSISNVAVAATTNVDGDSNSATAVAGDTLTCTWDFSDVDGDDDASTVVWSDDNGQIGTGATLSSGFVGDETITCTVSAHDGSVDGNSGNDSLTIDNTAPAVSNVAVAATTNMDGDNDPATAVVGDTLECAWDFSDVDGDGDASTVVWSDGSGQIGTGVTVSSGFVGGETVTCTVTAKDGSDTGNDSDDSLTIDNTAPAVSGVAIAATTDVDGDNNPATMVVGDILACTWDFADVDGNGDASTVSWTKDGNQAGTGATLSSGFAGGDAITCNVSANDGIDAGNVGQDTVTIDNTAPVVSNAVVVSTTNLDGDNDPATAIIGETLSCSWDYVDADSNGDASTVVWTVGGNEVGTGTTLSSDFVGGDVVTCNVLADDGIDAGNATNTSFSVDNTKPVVSNVQVTATTNVDGDNDTTTAGLGDTLACTWDYSDADGHTEATSVYWYKDGNVISNDTTLSSGFVGNDHLVCIVVPSDGIENGLPVEVHFDVTNTVPTVTEVTVTSTTNEDGDNNNGTAVAGDTLMCTWTFNDADGGSDLSTVEWHDGTSVVGTYAQLTGFVGNKNITCTVTPDDGIDAGTPDFDTLAIDNTPPEVVSALITSDPDPATVASELTCTPGSTTDADGTTSFTYTYQWTVNTINAGSTDTLSSGFVRDDEVVCFVTASDGIDPSETVEDSVTIDNALPVVTDVLFSTTAPTTNTMLTATVSTSDDDGDGVGLTYRWYVNDVEVTAVTGNTLDGSLYFSKSQGIRLDLIPNDTLDDGPLYTSTSIGVVNSPPGSPTVQINPNPADAGVDDLICTVTAPAVDPDGDSVTYIGSWTRNGNSYGGATTTTWSNDTIDGSGTAGGDVYACTMTAWDSEAGGTAQDSIVVSGCDFDPVLVTDQGTVRGVWMTDPLETLGAGLVWTMDEFSDIEVVTQFASLSDYDADIVDDTIALTIAGSGTGGTVYGGYLYYKRQGASSVVKVDLVDGTVEGEVTITDSDNCAWDWGGGSTIDIEADENGLWVVYGTDAPTCDLTIRSLATDLTLGPAIDTGVSAKTDMGNALLVDGVLYAVYGIDPPFTIDFAFDTLTQRSWDPAFTVCPYQGLGYLSSLQYNPTEQAAHAWYQFSRVSYDMSVSPRLGAMPSDPGDSCLDILDEGASTGDGVYWIDLGEGPILVDCDMITDGGGWTAIISPDDHSQTYIEQFPMAANSITSWTVHPTYGASWGIANITNLGVELEISYDEYRMVGTGFYDDPSGAMGKMRIGTTSQGSNLWHLSDAHTQALNGQSFFVDGTTVFSGQKTDVVLREDTISATGSTVLSIYTSGFSGFPFGKRYLAEVWVR
jgi:large repetitive protein